MSTTNPPPSGCCFPFKPFAFCEVLVCWLPNTWKTIQDSTHLVLVTGVMSCFIVIIHAAFNIYEHACSDDAITCLIDITTIIFASTVAVYVSGIIGQYDERLMQKEAQCKEQKAKLLNSYNDLLSDMDGLLTNATESASGLAERSFESKRRDFQRFLERAKTKFPPVLLEDGEMLTQFRQFCLNWLRVFQECSIDPVGTPKIVVTEDQLMMCTTINEVADLCLDRLKTTEVRFISVQRDEDKKMMNQHKKDFKRRTLSGGALAITAGGEGNAAVDAAHEVGNDMGALAVKKSRMSWIKCGEGGCTCKKNSQQEAFPFDCGLLCGKVVCLTNQHLALIMAFFIGLGVATLTVFDFLDDEGDPDPIKIILTVCDVFVMLCLIVLLINFEDIDLVQKLNVEVQMLTEQNHAVEAQSAKMKEFWHSAQNLTELWLYRTVPRLDLYKEIHSQLEDEEEEDLLTHITGANQALQDLEQSLGALEYWRNDGVLQIEDKKMFGKKINELCQETQFDKILMNLQDDVVHGDVMLKLKALPQAPASY